MALNAAAFGRRAPKAQLLGLAVPGAGVTAGWMVGGGVRMIAGKVPQVQPEQQDDKLKFICNFPGCGDQFNTWADLSAHWGTAHGYGGINFCDVCGNRFFPDSVFKTLSERSSDCKTFLERCPLLTKKTKPSELRSLFKQTAREQQKKSGDQQKKQKKSGNQQKKQKKSGNK